jgi:hypothetical protein
MPLKDGIVELRQKGRITAAHRELLAAVGVAVGTHTIARFLAEVNGEAEPQRTSKRPRRVRYVRGRAAHARSAAIRVSTVAMATTSSSPRSPSSKPITTRMTRRHPNNHALAVCASQTLATSDSKQFPMSKQINLVINGKGGVGKSDCDEIREPDRTVLAQILAQFAFSGLTGT